MNVLSEKAKKFTEAFEHCMKNEPLALRNAMGMNRQQFKSMQREQKKMEEAMKKLTPVQFKLIDMLIRQERRKVDQEIAERTIALNSCVNAALTETVDWTCDEIDKFWKVVNEMIPGDIQARSEIQKMNEKERVEMEAKVREFIIEALEADKKVREIKEELKFKFPKLSSAQRTNAVKEIKEEWLEQKGAERIAKIISGEEDKEVEKEPVKKEIVVNEKTKSAEEKEVVLMEAISVPTISEQLQGNIINFKKDKEAIYNIILEYENFISAKREELEVIKEKEKNVEKAIELLSSVGI